MTAALLDASAYGIGSLITQKKRFRVPDHQRDYAWTGNEVATFLTDIFDAIQRGATEYFVGTIVLIGPEDGAWEILDGQQRLATTMMAFAAIRDWLYERDKSDDAEQVDSEFISVRKLGASPTPRLALNQANRNIFSEFVARRSADADLDDFLEGEPLKTNRLLVEAAKLCRRMIATWLGKSGASEPDEIEKAYLLSEFLASRVRTVCLEVSTNSEAYVIFESLNNRGQDLSVLDLVKNHIYSLSAASDADRLRANWARMQDSIRERDADDFLKVFWTSRYGRVRLGSLFELMKAKYVDAPAVRRLSDELAADAHQYSALDDASSEVWAGVGRECQHFVDALTTLRAQQPRPIVLSALRAEMDPSAMRRLLWELLVLTVRYQTVGRKRTQDLETMYAELAPSIGDGRLQSPTENQRFRTLATDDDEFARDFAAFSDTNSKRALYLLAALEVFVDKDVYAADEVSSLVSPGAGVVLGTVIKRRPGSAWSKELENDPLLAEEVHARFGNRILLTHPETLELRGLGYAEARAALSASGFVTTRALAKNYEEWTRASVNARQAQLAETATRAWSVGTTP